MNSEPNIRASLVAEHTQHAPEQQETVFQPGFSFYAAFSSILVIALAAALDATSLSVALPVRRYSAQSPKSEITRATDHFKRP